MSAKSQYISCLVLATKWRRSYLSWKQVLEHFGVHTVLLSPLLPSTILSDTSVFCRLPGVSNIDWWGKGKCKTYLCMSFFHLILDTLYTDNLQKNYRGFRQSDLSVPTTFFQNCRWRNPIFAIIIRRVWRGAPEYRFLWQLSHSAVGATDGSMDYVRYARDTRLMSV